MADELGDWAHNALTGERDYERQKEILEKEMAFNSSEAQKVRDYEERMANTSYQRVVADLIAAGLNPGVAIGQGGAYTPSVNSAYVGSHNVQRSGDQFSSLLSSMFGIFGSLINSSIKAKQIENKSYISDKMYDLRRDIFHSKNVKNKTNTINSINNYLKSIKKPEAKSTSVSLAELDAFLTKNSVTRACEKTGFFPVFSIFNYLNNIC